MKKILVLLSGLLRGLDENMLSLFVQSKDLINVAKRGKETFLNRWLVPFRKKNLFVLFSVGIFLSNSFHSTLVTSSRTNFVYVGLGMCMPQGHTNLKFGSCHSLVCCDWNGLWRLSNKSISPEVFCSHHHANSLYLFSGCRNSMIFFQKAHRRKPMYPESLP